MTALVLDNTTDPFSSLLGNVRGVSTTHTGALQLQDGIERSIRKYTSKVITYRRGPVMSLANKRVLVLFDLLGVKHDKLTAPKPSELDAQYEACMIAYAVDNSVKHARQRYHSEAMLSKAAAMVWAEPVRQAITENLTLTTMRKLLGAKEYKRFMEEDITTLLGDNPNKEEVLAVMKTCLDWEYWRWFLRSWENAKVNEHTTGRVFSHYTLKNHFMNRFLFHYVITTDFN